MDKDGNELKGECEGLLVIKKPWPSTCRTVYGDHQRYLTTYMKPFKGCYFTGDGARRDKDGYYWITGRVDDVLNISGHRLGTAEIESCLITHADVVEAACVGVPHDIKGQCMFAYVILSDAAKDGAGDGLAEDKQKELRQLVREEIGAFAAPEAIIVVDAVPKTRSGKIMRRLLRKIACKEYDSLGDISTLANPDAVAKVIENRKKCPK